MINVGVTGKSGFIATHLLNTLGLNNEEFRAIPCEDGYFSDAKNLQSFVRQCDVIVHLAALNRHHSDQLIYDTNVGLVQQLIEALEETRSKAHVIFASSTQEEQGNPYGRSKLKGRELLSRWAERNEASFTGMIIPNVYGPFGKPYYNSVVATFSHQLTHGETPLIEVDGELKLIYVGELIEEILKVIRNKINHPALQVNYTPQCRVSELLSILENFKDNYFDRGIIPQLKTLFELYLFNTFRCYMDIENHFPVHLTQHSDERGSFAEIVKAEIMGQTSFSTTRPGITRGNHFHTRKIERFAVVKGEAEICLRRIGTGNSIKFNLSGNEPAYVDMPIWYTHSITNVGKSELVTLFWINEFFDPADPDTYYEEV